MITGSSIVVFDGIISTFDVFKILMPDIKQEDVIVPTADEFIIYENRPNGQA